MGADVAAFSSPLSLSKSKTWVGLRKSAVLLAGVLAVGSGSGGVFSGKVSGVSSGGFCIDRVDLGCFADVDLREREEELREVRGRVEAVVDLGARVEAGFVVDLVDGREDFAEDDAFLERRGTRPSIDLFFSIVYNYNMKAHKLTKKQLAVLEYIEDFTEENGYSPTYREIMAGLGLSSVSAVAEHVENLVEKGVIKKVPGAARSLEILDYKHESTVELFKVRMLDCGDEEKKILLKAAEILGIEVE